MTTFVKALSPAEATALLAGNTNNRALNKRAVARYSAAMQRGEWRIGNDAICLAADGTLLNGQHRLNAVAESGCTVQLLFREQVDPADLKAMDQGTKRIGADIATLVGHRMTKPQAKALRLLGTDWNFTLTMPTPSVDELISLDEAWGPFLGNANKLLIASKRTLAIPVAAAAEALRWKDLDGRQHMVADFFSIMWDNTPASDRATDSKHEDFIPCQFHRYVNDLARNNKQLRTFGQYKQVLVGLHSYINQVSLTKGNKLDIGSIELTMFNPFRG